MLLEHATSFEISTTRTIQDLEDLAADWHELWLKDPRATPFQSPAWLIPWARHFTAGEFCCQAVRVDQQLVGFLPTFIWKNPETQECELLLLGTGISDYCDCLMHPDYASEAFQAAWEHLGDTNEWDVLNFQELRPDSPLLAQAKYEPQSVVPFVPLPPTVEALWAAVPKAQRQNLRYYRRRAERLGACQWQSAGTPTLEPMLDELQQLLYLRFKERGQTVDPNNDMRQSFHCEAASQLLRVGALRMYRLVMGGRTAALFYGFAGHSRTWFYLSAFDPRFADVSPGTLMIGHVLEQAVRERCTYFDFLRGAERYKYLWGARDSQTFRRTSRRHAVQR